jgi:uncharacterized protein DUF4339
MQYKVMRNGQEYGPYTLADLQRYVALGNILVSDLVKSEGMDDWVPVSQVIGNIPIPATAAPQWAPAPADVYPSPPGLNWVVLLLLHIVTCGLFGLAWLIVQAIWVRKIEPTSKALIYVVVAIALMIVAGMTGQNHDMKDVAPIPNLAGIVMLYVGIFSIKGSIEDHYNSVEPIALRLSGVMTFFFGEIYLQYHLNEITKVKQSQRMSFAPTV